jgi:hypothetical protein
MHPLHATLIITTVPLTLLATHFSHSEPAPLSRTAAPDTVRARVLELVGDDGTLRARLNVEQGGEVVLRLLDQEGTIRVKLGAGTDGSGLVLNNDATEPGVHLLAGRKGSSVRIANKDGRERVVTP